MSDKKRFLADWSRADTPITEAWVGKSAIRKGIAERFADGVTEDLIDLGLKRIEDALHFARKHEQRVWGSGDEHEKARAEVERLEALLDKYNEERKPREQETTKEPGASVPGS